MTTKARVLRILEWAELKLEMLDRRDGGFPVASTPSRGTIFRALHCHAVWLMGEAARRAKEGRFLLSGAFTATEAVRTLQALEDEARIPRARCGETVERYVAWPGLVTDEPDWDGPDRETPEQRAALVSGDFWATSHLYAVFECARRYARFANLPGYDTHHTFNARLCYRGTPPGPVRTFLVRLDWSGHPIVKLEFPDGVDPYKWRAEE
jgi:hypothetical protein